MAAAAIVEKKRKECAKIRAFWLFPQFFLVGTGEAFGYVGQLEFFIRKALERMKLMSTGLFLSTLAMGYFRMSNLNEGKLESFYWVLAVLGVINFLVFLAFSMKHQYKVQAYNGLNDGEEKELNSWKDDNIVDTEKTINVEGKDEPYETLIDILT
ncbi:hypothetical protein LguiB_029844 [Lonicera macranthoides]